MKHFHVYDTTGEVMCVDADDWQFNKNDSCVWFHQGHGLDAQVVATFNWSNVVCVREEEDDDEGETITSVPPVFSGALN